MKFDLVGPAAIAATAFFTHVLPQADIEDPGYSKLSATQMSSRYVRCAPQRCRREIARSSC
jgi:hypothetical protein